MILNNNTENQGIQMYGGTISAENIARKKGKGN